MRVPDDLVGRRSELTFLRSRLAAARSGRGALLLCGGEAGVGKTRLLRELASDADPPVAWAGCPDDDGAPALWPWCEIVAALRADLGTLLASSPDDRFRTADAVARTLRAAGPALVVLDDVHRADAASLQVLRHVAGRLTDVPVLLVATHRPADPQSLLPGVLPDLMGAPGAQRLDLRGFGPAEVAALLDDPAAAPVVHELTGGNPLFVVEIARAVADGTWRAEGPQHPPRTVVDVVAARLARLAPATRELARTAAVVGREFAPDLVAAALGQAVADGAPALDELVGHALVEPTASGTNRFVHSLTRDAVDASLSSTERADRHRAVADALERDGVPDRPADLARHRRAAAVHGTPAQRAAARRPRTRSGCTAQR